MGRSFEVRKASMAKTQGAKIKVYSKYGKEIYMCAKNGGPDPDMNLSLKHLISKAKKDQVPAHVIDKALDKASGGGGEDYQPARYEGFGPGNAMVIVECLTDNPNRTFGDVRQCFTKTKAKIGTQGTCAHSFDHAAIFVFAGEDCGWSKIQKINDLNQSKKANIRILNEADLNYLIKKYKI